MQAAWKEMTRPILELYTESTDGSNIEAKDSALVRPHCVPVTLTCTAVHDVQCTTPAVGGGATRILLALPPGSSPRQDCFRLWPSKRRADAAAAAQVWHYREADPDLGAWQAKELLDHLEGVLANEPVEVISGQSIVEVKPQVRAAAAIPRNPLRPLCCARSDLAPRSSRCSAETPQVTEDMCAAASALTPYCTASAGAVGATCAAQ